jgi:hypothetical protein
LCWSVICVFIALISGKIGSLSAEGNDWQVSRVSGGWAGGEGSSTTLAGQKTGEW